MTSIQQVSETCLLVTWGNEIDVKLTAKIAQFVHQVELQMTEVFIEIVPSYCTVLLQVNLANVDSYHQVISVIADLERICAQVEQSDVLSFSHQKTIVLPVYYHPSVGPELETIADSLGCEIAEVVKRHYQQTYTVCALGFAPGFAFLASVDDKIAVPRLSTPRHKIPAGSVGIANQQTAVYPADSPGGWQIIGNCPQPLFFPNQQPMTPFNIGDKVQFEPISRDTFFNLGGKLWRN